MTDEWECEAWSKTMTGATPEAHEAGARCFIARPGERECGTREMCAAVMDVERRRVFQRIQEMAAAGDPVAAFLASEFRAAEDLLGGSSGDDTASRGEGRT